MHQDLSTSSESMLWTQILEHHSWNNPPELMDRRSAWEAAGKEHWWFGLRRSSRMGWMVAWHGPGIWPRRLELSLVIARTSWSGCVKNTLIRKRQRINRQVIRYGSFLAIDSQLQKGQRIVCWFGIQVIPRSPSLSDFCLQAVVGPLTNCSIILSILFCWNF